jgi:signal peptidase I
MSANLIYLLYLSIFAVVNTLLTSASIQWGLKRAAIAEVSLLKGFGLYLLFSLVGGLAAGLATIIFMVMSPSLSETTLDLMGYAVALASPAFLVALIYKSPIRKALRATLPFLFVSISAVLVTSLVIRRYAYEAFWIPTNAMAPTVLGEHWEAPCPQCGHPAYGTPRDPRFDFPLEGVPMVCSRELQSVYVTNQPQKRGGGDRIVVNKLLTPKRWDLIVFRFPGDPTQYYVKRLVGLPGEKLEIHDGAVWINGEKVDPPESIRGIRYSPTIESNGRVHSGPGSVPIELGQDEYFVLGDFGDQSADSRLWELGAPGYPPYAVPESHIVGVAINIYWPPSRWIGFR